MRVRIRHRTSYDYARPPRRVVQHLRLTPASGPHQIVRDWCIEAPGALLPSTDAFGNCCHELRLERPGRSLRIVAAGTVETRAGDGLWPVAPGGARSPDCLAETPLTAADARVRDLAAPFRAAVARDPMDGLRRLMTAVGAALTWQAGAGDVGTSAAAALAAGVGICQDHAHLLIAACRGLDVPARYVGGYLWGGEPKERLAAGHGWAEALVPGRGWLGLDATNDVIVGAAHIRVAVGLDYDGACPVRGARLGGGGETMDVSIELDARSQD